MSSKFTCRFCKEQFDAPKFLYKHLQTVHTAGTSRDNRTCPICGVLCTKYEGYRDHLLYIHGQTDEGQKLTFKSLNEFLVWKAELELKHNCKYVLQTSPKVLSSKEKKYFYQCDRSDPKAKDKKITSVVMKTCSSVISVVESSGVFKVEYWDVHTNHCERPSSPSAQTEIEAAISSVELVNAISESDDSFDRSDDLMPDNSSITKQSLYVKTNLPSSVNNFNSSPAVGVKNARTLQSSVQIDGPKKKNTNTSVLLSLASVACGKGIAKKPIEPLKQASKPEAEVNSENAPTKLRNLLSGPEQQNDDSAMDTSEVEILTPEPIKPKEVPPTTTVVSATTTTSPSVLAPAKTVAGLAAIAPKITNVTTNNPNSLFSSNSAFSNQLVIVNPLGMNQTPLSANQNVFTAGQNILVSLGSLGQNAVPATTAPRTIAPATVAGDKNKTLSSEVKTTKAETSVKVSLSDASATTKSSSTQSATNSVTSIVTSMPTATSVAPITLTTAMNPAPVILSSLPVGSTFMSVNNNLIPIATPSGAFLPTSLPPNIVLTPVPTTSAQSKDTSIKTIPSMPPNIVLTPVPSTTPQQKDSAFKGIPNLPPNIVLTPVPSTTVPNMSTVSVPPTNTQTPARLSVPSTVAITVSSIVKQPVYSSSAMKNASNIVTCTSVVSSTVLNTSSKNKNQKKNSKIAPVSPIADLPKFKTSTPVKTYSKMNKYTPNSISINSTTIIPALASRTGNTVSLIPINSTTPKTKSGPSARKRITKNSRSLLNNTSAVGTKVVNSKLSSSPISSVSNVIMKPQQLDAHKPGTLLFESSGEVYMLEPIENDVDNTTSLKKIAIQPSPTKIKIERSIQTDENLGTSVVMRKRPPPTDDSAVMLKVKCYQMEMKYLSMQAECKRLKVELTRERLKNAEVAGEKSAKVEDDSVSDSICKVSGIMKEIEDEFSENKCENIYTMTKTSVLRNLYEDLEDLCLQNIELYKELENYRAHDKFYKSLKKKLYEEEFET